MLKFKLLFLALSLALMMAPAAFAADYSGHFGDMDKNGDDYVTWDEFKEYFPHAEKSVFEKIAGDQDRFDHDLWHDFKDEHGYGHQEGAGEHN